MIVDSGKYYLYRHIRLDNNQIFYIGYGRKIKNYRCHKKEYERAFSKQGRNNFWWNIVNKAGYKVEIILETDSFEEIEEKEVEFIKLYGRRNLGKGSLVNLTDGGGGCKNISGATLAKKKAKKVDMNHINKMTELRILSGVTDAQREAARENMIKLNKSESHRKKNSLKMSERLKKPINQYDLEGNFIQQWDSLKSACKTLNIHSPNISANLKGITSNSGGFIWKYAKT